MFYPTYPYETARLRLRRQSMDDLDWQFALRQIPEVIRFLPFGGESMEEMKQVMERRTSMTHWEKPGDRIMMMVENKETRERLGEVSLFSTAHEKDTGELGYIFHPNHHGKGYAREAAKEIMRIGFEEAKQHRMTALCDPENKASLAVMLKLGMRQEGIAKSVSFERGEWQDLLTCAILEDEWRALEVV